MKVPTSGNSNMDNKLKFSDRLKALLKTEAHQDVDPYIFSEPEPFTTAAGRNCTVVPTKSSKVMQNCKKSKGKCIKERTKLTPVPSAGYRTVTDRRTDLDVEYGGGRSIDQKYSNIVQNKRRHLENLQRLRSRRQNRDHTLLYYPKAGAEISDSESSGDEMTVYQRHWFSGDTSTELNRSARLSQLRSQLRRRLIQLNRSDSDSEVLLRERARCLLEAAYKDPASTARALSGSPGTSKIIDGPLLVGGQCGAEGCQQISLPCTRHCSRHIMLNGDQLLFEHCTAKFSDNTQCCIPVFDVAHELPLCPEHARKRDNYNRKAQESKPKKARKKPASPTIPRPKPKSRPKKRKRPPANKLETKGLGLSSLGLGGGLKVELSDHEVFASLDPTEHDFGNVLNNLPADAFNDLFIESRNGEYEPSREEEEELERALEAVDKDVRNLERMGQTHGLLEPALLAQLMSDIAS
ncbi:hypothetical protein HZH66_015163 [Vespula vulgaris]|uniref:KANL2-like probable zinc-finger domain-containing protein n=1 Tax=Vespula vulgaris TaxID=7454 RepID=A0A834J1K0_VESVU|nr:hypothetical protein HZH66_015163 [Vespula vulgaris]